MFGELAGFVEHRKEFLVRFHGRDQRFLRHCEEVALEGAQHGLGPFDQALHLFKVIVGDARVAADLQRGAVDFGDDAGAAFFGVDQHFRRAQGVDIVARRTDPHGLVVMETMAAAHAVGFDAQHFGVNDLVAQQQHQPVRGPGEAVCVAAPAHRLGNGHGGQRFGQDLRQQRGGARAGLHGAVDEAFALVVGGFFQRGPVDAGLRGKAFQRPGGFAFGVQRDVEIRAQHFAALFGLLHGHAGQQHREPARGIERLGAVAVDGDAALGQRVDDAIEQRLGQTRQGLDRQFFSAQFDQKRLHFTHGAALCVLFLLPPGEGARRADEGTVCGHGVACAVPSPQPLSRWERGLDFGAQFDQQVLHIHAGFLRLTIRSSISFSLRCDLIGPS